MFSITPVQDLRCTTSILQRIAVCMNRKRGENKIDIMIRDVQPQVATYKECLVAQSACQIELQSSRNIHGRDNRCIT